MALENPQMQEGEIQNPNNGDAVLQQSEGDIATASETGGHLQERSKWPS